MSYNAHASRVPVPGNTGLVVGYGKNNGSSSFMSEYTLVSFITNWSSALLVSGIFVEGNSDVCVRDRETGCGICGRR